MMSYITYQQLICYSTSSILLIIKISDVFTNFLTVKEVKYKIILLPQLRYKVPNIVKYLSKQPIYRYFLNCNSSSRLTFTLSQKAMYIHTYAHFLGLYTNTNYRLSSAPYMDIIGPIITDMRRITMPASTSIIIGSRAAISVCVAISTSSS